MVQPVSRGGCSQSPSKRGARGPGPVGPGTPYSDSIPRKIFSNRNGIIVFLRSFIFSLANGRTWCNLCHVVGIHRAHGRGGPGGLWGWGPPYSETFPNKNDIIFSFALLHIFGRSAGIQPSQGLGFDVIYVLLRHCCLFFLDTTND